MPGPGVTLLDPELAPAPQPVLVQLPCSLLELLKATVPVGAEVFPSGWGSCSLPGAGLLSEQWNCSLVPPEMGMCVTVPLLGSCYPARMSPWPLLQLN